MRTNTQGPQGSQTWSRTPQFDQAAYDRAMADWSQQNASADNGSWREMVPGLYSEAGLDGGQQIPRSGTTLPAPSRDQFSTDTWTLNTILSPEQQALFDANQSSQLGQAKLLGSLTDRVGDATRNAPDWASLPQLNSERLNPEGIRQDAADSIYRQNTRYLDPQVAEQQRMLEGRLADQGFTPGTPAYAAEMERFSQGRERSYADARDKAITGGYSAGSQMFGQGLASQQQQNAVRQQAMAQLLQMRNQPLAELNALRTGSQPQLPTGNTSSPTPNLAGTDVMGAFNQDFQNQLGAYNADIGSQNGMMGGLGSLAMAAAMYF